MQKTITILCLLFSLGLNAQTTSTFEEFVMEADTFLNGSDGTVAFHSGNAIFPVNHNFDWGSWSGWAISNTTDVTSAGYTNQYSSITGGGYDQSAQYAVGFVSGSSRIELSDDAIGGAVEGFYITNGTYPYLSMLNGDGFAKKFGGETGDDPDYFLLTIKGYYQGAVNSDSVDFYLADYRFEDNSQDYIVDEWTFIDLTSLGPVDSLIFTLNSSDSGMFGINTPGYFCIDNFSTLDGPLTSTNETLDNTVFEVFPNPAGDQVFIKQFNNGRGTISIYNTLGVMIQQEVINNQVEEFDISTLPAGTYWIRFNSDEGEQVEGFIKQ